MAHEGDGEGKVNKQTEEKLKKLRKRNAELVALAKQLDEKNKSLKSESEHFVSVVVNKLVCITTLMATMCFLSPPPLLSPLSPHLSLLPLPLLLPLHLFPLSHSPPLHSLPSLPSPQQKQAVSPAEAEHHARKNLARQHAKDIMEYTQQIHAKNREIEALKKRITKVRERVCVWGGRREKILLETG